MGKTLSLKLNEKELKKVDYYLKKKRIPSDPWNNESQYI